MYTGIKITNLVLLLFVTFNERMYVLIRTPRRKIRCWCAHAQTSVGPSVWSQCSYGIGDRIFRRKSLQKYSSSSKDIFCDTSWRRDSLFQDINMDVICLIYKHFIPKPIKNVHPSNGRKFKMVVRNKRLETGLHLETQFVLISCGCGWSQCLRVGMGVGWYAVAALWRDGGGEISNRCLGKGRRGGVMLGDDWCQVTFAVSWTLVSIFVDSAELISAKRCAAC